MSSSPRIDVSFPTLSGLTLRGWLFPAAKRGPAIILSPGFNMPKEAVVPELAAWFQARDVTALVFDSHGIGASDGEPRCDTDMQKRIEDLHDAVTFLSSQSLVDPTKIAIWGLCFDGHIALAVGAVDKRLGAVISFSPMIDISGDQERREPMLELAMQDRVGRLAGEEPMYLPVVNEDGTMPLGQVIGAEFFGTLERLNIPVENRVCVQTYYRALSWSIMHLLPKVSPTPVMIVTPEHDQVCPVSSQMDTFERLGEPKEHCLLPGKGHFDWMFGDTDAVMNKQLDFLKKYMHF
ncbi:alpha/beta-hydrolase [Decorospora gaudefroyi]|uniref:Alpha/beta-hydrolase n=1 Tax=Decorospora gaudefroyi TaxID=184978 RepID=A0A6A5KYR5_9PLEO|nr:alpha/beta-hydrolase [Decorospora gaudefroyi]